MAGSKMRIMNIYVPNESCARRVFRMFAALFITSRETIMGGAFNCVENLDLDKMGGNLSRGIYGADELLKFKSDFYLLEAFRVRHPHKKEYTFQGGPIHLRLDMLSRSNVSHTTCSVSDYYYVGPVIEPTVHDQLK